MVALNEWNCQYVGDLIDPLGVFFLSKLDHLRNERYWASNQSEKDKAQRRLENNRLVINIASALKWCGIFVVRLTILQFCTRCNRCSVVWKAALEWISIVEAWSNKRLHQGFACITSYAWPNVSNVAYLAVTRLCCQCNLRLHSTSNVEFRTDGFGTPWCPPIVKELSEGKSFHCFDGGIWLPMTSRCST